MVTAAADRILGVIAAAVEDGRAVWLVRDGAPPIARVTVWVEHNDGFARPGPSAPQPVVDELIAARHIDISATAAPIEGAGPAGRRVQPTVQGWATRTDLPTGDLAARIQTWEALP